MYTGQANSVEAVCYERAHQEKVLAVISSEFEKVFQEFVETDAGKLIPLDDLMQLESKLGIKVTVNKKNTATNKQKNLINIIKNSIDGFEKNRQKYIDLMDPELLEEEAEDLNAFKAQTVKIECPIIHATLFTNLDELKQYKISFYGIAPQRLFDVVSNLSQFSREYFASYDENKYQQFDACEDFKLDKLEEGDTYTAYGVIGGGIRSHLLYKLHPECFPNRSQWALWALYYLSNKESFDCAMDSEFLMIDVKESFIQQNYFYPYDLFTFYAYHLYKMLDNKAKEMNAYIDPKYKYVIVDAFLNYVYDAHSSEIAVLRSRIVEGGLRND